MQIHRKSKIFLCCLDLSVTPATPQTIFSVKIKDITQLPQSALITTSAYGITLIFKTTDHVAALGITRLRCSAGKVSAKRVKARPPSWSQNRACFPTIHFVSIQISSLYTSFEYSNARQSAHQILSLHCQCV